MSIAALTAVFTYSETSGNDRLVLLAVADNAGDPEWVAWPGIDTIAAKARCSRSTAIRSMRSLIDGGHVEIVKAGGGRESNRYRVLRPWEGCQSDTGSKLAGVSDPTGRGVTLDTAAGSPVTPEPSLNRQEPSGGRKRPARPMPDDRALGEMGFQFASERGVNPDIEWEKFCAHHLARDSRFVDWDQAWRTWVLKAAQWHPAAGSSTVTRVSGRDVVVGSVKTLAPDRTATAHRHGWSMAGLARSDAEDVCDQYAEHDEIRAFWQGYEAAGGEKAPSLRAVPNA